jgi:calcineurin-like phosphoesterase family protein
MPLSREKNAKRSIFSVFIEDFEIINQYDSENVQLHHFPQTGENVSQQT